MKSKGKRVIKTSELNDVNGTRLQQSGVASGRRLEVSSVVTMRNPHPTSNAQHNDAAESSSVFQIIPIIGDGNCLFRSISYFLHGTQEHHDKLRAEAVKYIRRNWNDLKHHLVITDPSLSDERSYCYHMKQDKTFGTSVEILALSRILKLNFNIYTETKRPTNDTIRTSNMPTKIETDEPGRETCNLLFTGNLEKGHFEALTKIDTSSKTNQRTQEVSMTKIKKANGQVERRVEEDNEENGDKHTLSKSITSESDKTRKTNPNMKQSTRSKWTNEEYKEIVWCHFHTIETDGTANLNKTFELWKQRNGNSNRQLTANTLATQRRFILNNNKLTQDQIEDIRRRVKINTQNLENDQDIEDLSIQQLKDYIPKSNNESESNAAQQTTNSKTEPLKTNETELIKLKEKIIRKLENCENTIEITCRPPLKKINETQQARTLIKLGNVVIKQIINAQKEVYNHITPINRLIYATAESIQENLIPKICKENQRTKQTNTEQPWKKRIYIKIGLLRKDLSQLKECLNLNLNDTMKEKKNKLYKKYKIKNNKDHEKVMEKLKQQISAKTNRVRRYIERSNQYHHNILFSNNTKKFYNNILNKNVRTINTPDPKELETYWKNIWENETTYNKQAEWIEEEYRRTSKVERMVWEGITEADIKLVLNTSANWKAPGIDGIPNFWLKRLTAIHSQLARAFNEMISSNEEIPNWLTKGKTHLIPKNENTEKAKNYRPITCLNNIYKTLTKVIAEKLYKHLQGNQLFPQEQKGCSKNNYGCKDHLLTSKLIDKDCKENRKNLALAWIDYVKAFDSIPHSWIIEALNIYRTSDQILSFLYRVMKTWKTDLNLTTTEKTLTIENIDIKTGIYQGDSLSALLFCVILFPLSSILNNSNTGYQCKNEKTKINHLLYIDDAKLIAKDEEELEKQLHLVKRFSDDVGMKFGIDKCAKATFIKGKIKASSNINLDDFNTIRSLEHLEAYKYLGVEEHDGVQHKKMKTKLKSEYYRRIRQIMKTELNARNKITAISSLAVPVIQYSFGIIKWTKAEIRKIDCQTRKLLTMYGALHPRSDINRLYVSRKEGGRGMQNIEDSYSIAIEGLNQYLKLKSNTDKYLRMVYRQQTKDYKDISNKEDNQEDKNNRTSETEEVKTYKNHLKNQLKKYQLTTWKQKPMHGQILKETEKETINSNLTWQWLKHANLKSETEALVTACQEQAIATNYMKARIMRTGNDPKCRLCRTHNETIHHVVSGCPILAKNAYLDRHNIVAAQLHWNICREFKIEVEDRWYKHKPDPVINTPEVTIIWDMQVQTDREIKANKPDIIVKNKKHKTCLLIDVAIPADSNITDKEAEKRLKYKDLQIETQRLWNLKTKIVPVVIGATGLISNATTEAIKELPGKQNLAMMQKAVVLSTAHIVRKVL